MTGLVVLVLIAAVAGSFASGWKAGAGRTRRKTAEANLKVSRAQTEAEQNRPISADAAADRLRSGG